MPVPFRPDGLLLDLDGTLADSLGVMHSVYEKFVRHCGGTPTEAEFNDLNGPPLSRIVAILKETYGMPQAHSELYELYGCFIDEAYSEVKPNDGADVLLKAAKEHDCTVGIVTSNSLVRTQMWLKSVRFDHAIDFIVTSEDVSKGKPSPEPYLYGVSKLGSVADRTAAVEDSVQGLQSALGAGIRAYGLNINVAGAIQIVSLRELCGLLW